LKKDPNSRRSDISELTTRRLSVYLRCVQILEAAGVETVSSKELAEQFHLNSAQFRKDLAYFGEFGVRGIGYRVAALRRHLVEILGLDRKIRLVIMGAGNLGMALADYAGFNAGGFEVVALFDSDSHKIGQASRGGVQIRDVRDLVPFMNSSPVDIAVLAVPARVAQAVLDQVSEAGIHAVLNFVPARLKVPPGVRVNTVDLKVQVETLVFHLARQEREDTLPAEPPTEPDARA
jgi:redox-sensing transcriptional repressor